MATVSVTYLVIGGGGNGGSAGTPAPGNPAVGGGGGAGGVLQGTTTLSIGTVYTATVGAAGSSSVFNGLTAFGGGNGGSAGGSGSNGASGGGGSNGPGGTATQGYNGGYGFVNGGGDNGGCGGGGGGSTAAGAAGSTNFVNYYYGGAGGAGTTSSITGTAVTYAGGGGGGGIHPPNYAAGSGGAGGSGGGGSGAGFTGGTGGSATNYGSGGGGGAGGTNAGGAGYQGVVIISVPTAQYSATLTGSPTVTTSGSNTIVTFTSSGSITLNQIPTAGAGGSGGGGTGGLSGNGVAGTTNTGSGGGGAGGTGSSTQYGGSGGSGVIVFSYTSTSQLYTGGTITTSDGNYIHTFTSSGTLTPTIPILADANTGATTNLPVGNTAQRSTWAGSGSTRYNTTLGTLEWYSAVTATWYPLTTFMYLDSTGSTGAGIMPAGTTAQRDATLGGGSTRYNSTLGTLEWYNSATSSWTPLSTFLYLDATGTNGAAIMPSGNTAQRDTTLGYGSTRFNTSTSTLEWYNSNTSTWNSV